MCGAGVCVPRTLRLPRRTRRCTRLPPLSWKTCFSWQRVSGAWQHISTTAAVSEPPLLGGRRRCRPLGGCCFVHPLTLSPSTCRYTYGETLGRWRTADLLIGLAYLCRKVGCGGGWHHRPRYDAPSPAGGSPRSSTDSGPWPCTTALSRGTQPWRTATLEESSR
jgi:hypothetical protein